MTLRLLQQLLLPKTVWQQLLSFTFQNIYISFQVKEGVLTLSRRCGWKLIEYVFSFRHSAILCPVIPDPSVMFKSMMSGNKEHEVIFDSLGNNCIVFMHWSSHSIYIYFTQFLCLFCSLVSCSAFQSISGGLYTPVPENIERCKIIVVSENRETKENPWHSLGQQSPPKIHTRQWEWEGFVLFPPHFEQN